MRACLIPSLIEQLRPKIFVQASMEEFLHGRWPVNGGPGPPLSSVTSSRCGRRATRVPGGHRVPGFPPSIRCSHSDCMSATILFRALSGGLGSLMDSDQDTAAQVSINQGRHLVHLRVVMMLFSWDGWGAIMPRTWAGKSGAEDDAGNNPWPMSAVSSSRSAPHHPFQ